jgi:hypothetical protein
LYGAAFILKYVIQLIAVGVKCFCHMTLFKNYTLLTICAFEQCCVAFILKCTKIGLPYDSSPFISSPVISSRSFRPLVISSPVISSPVISSPGHLVPWSFRPLLSHQPIQFHMCKIIQFHMCKIILKMWYVVTCHNYHNLRSLISLYSNYIYSETCVTVVTLHTSVTHVTIVT